MRKNEKYCAEKLKMYLEHHGHNAAFKDGSDPPDIDFIVGSSRWAVEHTQLFQYVDRSGVEESRSKIDEINLAVEQRLIDSTEGRRKSSWVLALYGLSSYTQRKAIQEAALQSILNDNLDPFSAIPRNVAVLRRVQDSTGRILVLSMLPPTSRVPQSNRFSADIQASINYAVERILKKKVPTLRKLKDYDKRVLLIQSKYMFLSTMNLSKAVHANAHLNNGIDRVFLVTNDEVSVVQ